MKCKMCGGAGVIQGQAPGLVSCCPACNGKGFIEMTNEEYLKSCNTEQLAKEILTIVDEEILYAWHKEYHKVDDYWNDKDAVLRWLKQPHKPIS